MVTGISVIALQTLIIYLTRPTYRKLIQHSHVVGFLRFEDKISLNLAKITAIIIGMVWNYLFYSRVVFKNVPKNQEVEDITSIV